MNALICRRVRDRSRRLSQSRRPRKNRRNGRSLYGLPESLKAQGKTYSAQSVQKEFEEAWKQADTKLRVEDL